MQTSDIYHIWGIKGFKMARLRYMSGLCIVKTNTGEYHCPRCHTDKGSTRLFPKSRESWVKTPRQASPKKNRTHSLLSPLPSPVRRACRTGIKQAAIIRINLRSSAASVDKKLPPLVAAAWCRSCRSKTLFRYDERLAAAGVAQHAEAGIEEFRQRRAVH